jgi:molybdate transport system ATP-binding protein
LCNYHEKPILKNIDWTIKKGDFWHLLGLMVLVKALCSLITGDNTKATDRIYIFWYKRRKWRKHLGYKKEYWLLFDCND